jgi:arylsulfatase A-like enzyme
MYDPVDVILPPSFNSAEHALPAHLQQLYIEREQAKSNRNGQRVFAVTADEARQAIALTYGMITMIDDCLGRILHCLEASGLAGNTIVIFNADHGDFMGDHQLLLKGALHYQGLVRVPFIWSDPNAGGNGLVNSGLCGTIDLARTILDRAGLEGHNGIQGVSLLRAVEGGETGHEAMVIEEHQRRGYMGLKNNFRARSLITGDYRLTLYEGVEWGELYDLKNDPAEIRNLWDDPRAANKRHEFTEQLARKMMELTDTSPLALHHGP